MSKVQLEENLKKLLIEVENIKEELAYIEEEITKSWPREFTTYVHGSELLEDSAFCEFVEHAGWEKNSSEEGNLSRCHYEHEITYSVSKSGETTVIAIDGRKVMPSAVKVKQVKCSGEACMIDEIEAVE